MGKIGNTNALRHGATSESQIRPAARNHRRRVLRQIGLRASDLDAIGRGYLDAYVALTAKIALLDAYFEEHGLLKPNGEPQGAVRFYVALQNSARLALGRLEEHVRVKRDDPVAELNAYLAANYGDDDPT